MFSRFTVLVMFITFLALFVNAAPLADSLDATHKRELVASHQWIARHAQGAATVTEQTVVVGKK